MRQLKISKQYTNRDSRSLELVLNEIGKNPVLNADEEVDLARRIRDGDQVALDKLVKSNLRFVVSVSKQYQNQGLSLGDLINEGSIGLTKAAKKFDETRGFKFISYAVWWVRQSILQSIADNSKIVRQPVNRGGMASNILNTISSLQQKLVREPTDEEIIEAAEITKEDYAYFLSSQRAVSLDAPIGDDGESTLIDIIPNFEKSSDSVLIEESRKMDINRVLGKILDEKELDVIIMFYGLNQEKPLSLEDISEKMKLSRERVRQIKEKALRRIRKNSQGRALRSYI